MPVIQRESNLRGGEAASGTSVPVSSTNLQENYTILQEEESSCRRLDRVACNFGACKLQTLECVRWRVQIGRKKSECVSKEYYSGKVWFDGISHFTLTN